MGTDAGALLEETASRLLFAHSLFNGHPRFFGYITAPPAPIGILGDFLAAAVNPNVGAYGNTRPLATEIESQTVRWIAELIGYPVDCGGLPSQWGQHGKLRLLSRRACCQGNRGRTHVHGVSGDSGHRLRVYCLGRNAHVGFKRPQTIVSVRPPAIRWIATDAGTFGWNVGAFYAATSRRISPREMCHASSSELRARSARARSIPCPRSARALQARLRSVVPRRWSLWSFAAAVPEVPDDLRGLSSG